MAPAEHTDLSDEKLVAYLDEELSASEREQTAAALSRNPEARARLERLERGGRPFGDAFDVLLEAAPDTRLQAMFADVMTKQGPASAASADEKVVPFRQPLAAGRVPLWRMAAAAAILALVFTGGLATGGFFDNPQTPPQLAAEQKPGWREAAARYVALFSKETLEGMPSDPGARQANLQRAEQALGLKLSGERIANPVLAFQGTQLLQLDGKPLAQISFLHDGRTPVALCIIRTANPPQGAQKEQRHGLNVVHWIADGYGFMVIGKVPEPELNQISETFKARFS